MNDLITPDGAVQALSQIREYLPNVLLGLRKAKEVFDKIHSFEDVETYLLRGQGLSPNTYKCYLTAVKQLYAFTEGLNPIQVTPGHIEAFYDDVSQRVDRNTAYLRIRGLKRFFAGISKVIPGYVSPFDVMDKKLTKKLNRTKKGNRTKKALFKGEVKALLSWLAEDASIKGVADHAIVFMLVTSGLRASELCQLRFRDLELDESGTWKAVFTGKGGEDAEQELYTPALEAARAYFAEQFNRDPRPDDYLLYSLPAFNGDAPRKLTPHRLWVRVKSIGERAKEAGVIKRDINFSPHLFRRSYATVLYKSGMKIKAIQEKTRHASIETLVKHYVYDDDPASPFLQAALA